MKSFERFLDDDRKNIRQQEISFRADVFGIFGCGMLVY